MQILVPIKVPAEPAAPQAQVTLSTARLRVMSLCASLTMLFIVAGCDRHTDRAPQKMAVQAAPAESMENVRAGGEASYIGIVRAENETDLSFKVGGILDLIGQAPGSDWDEGTPVRAGMLLASLKQSDFTNALSSAQAHEDLAKKVRDRFRKLRETDAISQQEFDVAEANWLAARAQLDQAEQNLRDSRLRAPTNGAVLVRYVNSGVTVAGGQKVLRFADLSRMSVELGVPDRVINQFSQGKEFDVEVSALEGRRPFRGIVSEVGVAASQETRLFRVVIKVPNPDGLIRSGMTATVRVGDLAPFAPGSVRVPLSTLVTFSPANQGPGTNSSQLAVFVVNDGRATRRPIKTGDILHSSIIVTEGLRPGEMVVTAGASFLYDGAPVEVLSATPTGD